jgi:glucan biosynthesis protein C
MGRRLPQALGGARLIIVPIAVLALLRLSLAPRFPSTHALLDDWFNHATYLSVFLLGAALARAPDLWRQFVPWRWFALLVALSGWALLVAFAAAYTPQVPAPEPLRMVARSVYACVQWCAIVAVLGFAVLHFNRDHAWRPYLTEAVFPIYILHQTVTVLLSQALLPLGWQPALEGPLLVVGTFVLSFAGYEAVRRVAWLRPCFGLGRAKKPAGAALAATGRTSVPPPACAAGTGGSSSTGSR